MSIRVVINGANGKMGQVSVAAIDAAAAIEMLHAFALAHDDVMDHSSSRRGEPSIWQRFASFHADNGWEGNAKEFGEAVAILVGDLAHVIADSLVRDLAPCLLYTSPSP